MKNYSKIAGILCAIALVCAAILAGINMLTSQVIANNDKKTQENAVQTICKTVNLEYDTFDKEDINKSVTADGAKYTATVSAVYKVKKNNAIVCNIYTVSGKNDYGNITLMVEVEKNAAGSNVVGAVELIDNGQSFASTVSAFLKSTYISSVDTSNFEGGAKTEVTPATTKFDDTALKSIDVKCGATYGATLVRDLTAAALKTANGGAN